MKRQTRKVLEWLSVEGQGKQPCHKEKHGEKVLSAKKGNHIGDLDLVV